jgi:UPF0716 protein FxsA
MPFLLVLTIIVLVEAVAFATVSELIGGLPAVAGLAATTLGGVALLARQGRAAGRRLDAALRGAREPGAIGRELWLALTAALLAFPGYASDAIGLLLLVPQVRMLLRDLVFLRLAGVFRRARPATVIDATWRDETAPPRNLPR